MNHNRLAIVFCVAAAACTNCFGAKLAIEDVADIPNPRLEQRWVVDLTGTIEMEDLDRVNEFCESIFKSDSAEVAVVIIKTTGNSSIERFADQLFNRWKIGNSGANDGILFLVARDDRKMKIELGDGIDGKREEEIAQEILDEEVTPRFKAGEFGEGIYAGTFSTALRIFRLAEAELENEFDSPAAIPNNPRVTENSRNQPRGNIRQGNGNRKSPALPILLGGGILGLGGLSLAGGRYWLRYRKRNCNHCSNEMVLLEEEQDDQFLDQAEQTEERIGSVDYDVWACLQCEDVLKFRYGRFFTRYSKCPGCSYKTKLEIKKTIVSATTSHGGRVHVKEKCVHCRYRDEHYYSTPRLSKNNSSGGSSFGGGSSSGGSGGSGFGGGSSSGGGATGSW